MGKEICCIGSSSSTLAKRPPARWTWRTIFKNIWWIYYSVRRGIRNIITWVPVIWYDEDYDWAFLARIMEFKFRKMSINFRDNGHTVDYLKVTKELLTCAELLKRLQKDDISNENLMNEWQHSLGRMIGKHLRSWWD